MNKYTVAAINRSETSMVLALNLKLCRNVQSYACSDQSKTRSEALKKRPCCWAPGGLRNRLHNIGVRLIETNPDTRMATPIVTANSWRRRPTMPPMNSTGMNTAASDNVIERMVNATSFDPSKAAVIG